MADQESAAPPAELPPIQYPPTIPGEMSSRSLGTMLSAGIGAIVGWFGGHSYARSKMIDFNGEVAKLTNEKILKGGASAGLASMGASDLGGSMMHAGATIGGGTFRENAHYELLKSGKYRFAKMMEIFGGTGTFALATAAIGALVGFIGYKTFGPADRKIPMGSPTPDLAQEAPSLPPTSPIPDIVPEMAEPAPRDWAAKVAARPEPAPRVQGA